MILFLFLTLTRELHWNRSTPVTSAQSCGMGSPGGTQELPQCSFKPAKYLINLKLTGKKWDYISFGNHVGLVRFCKSFKHALISKLMNQLTEIKQYLKAFEDAMQSTQLLVGRWEDGSSSACRDGMGAVGTLQPACTPCCSKCPKALHSSLNCRHSHSTRGLSDRFVPFR